MKTRTFKALLIIVILLQLASGTIAVMDVRTANAPNERDALLKLSSDLLQFQAVLGDYELTVAAGNQVAETEDYQKTRDAVYTDIDQLIQMNQAHPDRVEVYNELRNVFEASYRIIQALRETSNKREGVDRWSILIVMLTGMRKLDKIAHTMYDDVSKMVATAPKRETSGPLGIVAVVCSVLSISIAGLLLLKGPTSI